MLPFLIDMARLFELFVAEWLKAHLPAGLSLRAQEQVHIGEGGNLYFEIDLVLYGRATEAALCVLDTKYRPASAPAPDEIAQVLAYAEVKGCDKALLVYPAPLDAALDEWVGDIRVSSATFSLDSDIEVSGQVFLQELLRTVAPAVSA
jgi:5-methylcytosine-specific restriction enzyme subunit McrC